ncbi:MAG: hypothetical protein PVF45_14470, partial [Anaerolineae bacterium]
LLLTLSYVVGVVLSGPAEIIMKRQRGYIKSTIPLPKLQQELISAFEALFEIKIEQWSGTHFYVCRSLVLECMPYLEQMIQRQSSLRQLRMNLIPAATIWSIAGIGWGIREINNNSVAWGCALAISSAILWVSVVLTMIDRMNSNENREVREVHTAFLAGYKSGLFDEKKSEPDRKSRLSLFDIFLSHKEKDQ